jgi:hypothetical protein
MNIPNLAPYSKAVVAVIGLLLVLAQTLMDGSISASDIGLITTAFATAVAVFHVPNIPAE